MNFMSPYLEKVEMIMHIIVMIIIIIIVIIIVTIVITMTKILINNGN